MTFKCIFCSSLRNVLISQKTRDSNYQVVKCKKCYLIQLHPLPSNEAEKKFYDTDKRAKLVLGRVKIRDLAKRAQQDTNRRVEFIKRHFNKKATILDLGSGYGFFLKALKENGFKPMGLEVSRERRKISKRLTNVEVLSSKIELSNNAKNKFDAITIFHVLEHVANPVELCTDLKSFLKPKGKLIIEVPNANDHMCKSSAFYRQFFWQRAHISYFTNQTLRKVLTKAGFKNIKIKGVQRYSFENTINWLKKGKPQLASPSYKSVKQLQWLDQVYKKTLERKLTSDTLWIEAKVLNS